MRAAILNYYVGIHEEVLEILDRLGIQSYCLWENMKGVPPEGDPRMGTHIWPGVNSALLVTFEDEKLDTLREALREDPENSRPDKIRAYVWQLLEEL